MDAWTVVGVHLFECPCIPLSCSVALAAYLQGRSIEIAKPLSAKLAMLNALDIALVADITRLTRESSDRNDHVIRNDDALGQIKHWRETSQRIAQEMENMEIERLAPSRVMILASGVLDPLEPGPWRVRTAVLAGLGILGLVLLACARPGRLHRSQ